MKATHITPSRLSSCAVLGFALTFPSLTAKSASCGDSQDTAINTPTTQLNPPSSNSEMVLDHLVEEIQLGRLSFNKIPTEHLKAHRIAQACMERYDCATELLSKLSADEVHNVVGYNRVIDYFRHIDLTKHAELPCFSDKRVLDAFEALLSGDSVNLYQLGSLYPVMVKLSDDPQGLSERTAACFLKELLQSSNSPEALLTRINLYAPEELLRESSLGTKLAESITFAPSDITVKALIIANAPADAVARHLREAHLSDEKLCSTVPFEHLSPELEDRIVKIILSKPTSALGGITDNQTLLLSERIQQATLDAVAKDISLACILRPIELMGYVGDTYRGRLTAVIKDSLKHPHIIEKLRSSIEKDFSVLKDLPVEVMDYPEIQHQSRLSLHKVIHSQTLLPDQSETAYRIIKRFAHTLPDVTLLIERVQPHRLAHRLPALVRDNPRVMHHFGFSLNEVSAATADAYHSSIQAFQALGISGFGRFDCAQEILRNRLLVADEQTRTRVKQYTDAADQAVNQYVPRDDDYADLYDRGEFTAQIEESSCKGCLAMFYSDQLGAETPVPEMQPDDRPLCVILSAQPSADTQGSFSAQEDSLPSRDYIDDLTTHYQVLYYEITDLAADTKAIADACKILNKKIAIMPILAHGTRSGTGYILSPDRRKSDAINSYARNHGYRFLAELGPHVTEQTIIPVLSCSAALLGSDSPAAMTHRALPNTTVLAPDASTGARLIFYRNGRFKEVIFNDASCIAYRPGAKKGVVISGPHEFSFEEKRYEHPWKATIAQVVDTIKNFIIFYLVSHPLVDWYFRRRENRQALKRAEEREKEQNRRQPRLPGFEEL